jgi:hypothetical protein
MCIGFQADTQKHEQNNRREKALCYQEKTLASDDFLSYLKINLKIIF